ncbi:hypothetical protein AX15_000117 [Amanita polypyramis BW_CC]|nr:hypothetical protein AX15_000117 [Amanita polypyramis BW_CC]
MDRRRGTSTRPATSEELNCWSSTAELLRTLGSKYDKSGTVGTIERVNRLISAWPTDDTLPAEGIDGVKTIHRKLVPGISEIKSAAQEELGAIERAIEQVDVLVALRKAPEQLLPEKRKRPRGPSPSVTSTAATNQTGNNRGVSITLPARPSPTGSISRELKLRREALVKQPLQQGRKVAFHPRAAKSSSGGADTDENTWILALVTRCINADNYEVQDAEPQEDGQPGLLYTTSLRAIIPLPDPTAPVGSPAHVGSYQGFPVGSTVMALYPDTSCFYRAEVTATPKDLQTPGRGPPSSKYTPTYKLKFEDDDNQEHSVAAQWVVEWPGNIK